MPNIPVLAGYPGFAGRLEQRGSRMSGYESWEKTFCPFNKGTPEAAEARNFDITETIGYYWLSEVL